MRWKELLAYTFASLVIAVVAMGIAFAFYDVETLWGLAKVGAGGFSLGFILLIFFS